MSNNEELIAQFKDITGVTEERAKFYLESSNWTLQLALSSFYEGEPENEIMDVTETAELSDDDDRKVTNQSPNASTGTASKAADTGFKKSSTRPKVATLHNMARPSSDDDEEEGQAFYAGGSERSGQQVLGPSKRKNFRDQLAEMLRLAHESGAIETQSREPSTSGRSSLYQGTGLRLGQTESDHQVVSGSDRPSRPQNIEPVVLKLWSQGFSINDGDLRPYDEPQNREFFESVMKGQIPNELRQMGHVLSVDVEDHRHEDYKKPVTKVKTFKGSGHTLGSPAPAIEASIPPSSTAIDDNTATWPADKIIVDTTAPTTMIQIRLSDGSRLSAQFNHSHTIDDIRNYIISTRPQYENQNFVLVSAFPTKELSDGSQTIERAGLLNASIMQRLK